MQICVNTIQVTNEVIMALKTVFSMVKTMETSVIVFEKVIMALEIILTMVKTMETSVMLL